jgi:hypothetical protein
MSNSLINMARERSPFTGAFHAVLMVMCNRADKFGVCWPAQDLIAYDARVSQSTVVDAINAFKAAGILIVKKRQSNQIFAVDELCNEYHLNLSRLPVIPYVSRRKGMKIKSIIRGKPSRYVTVPAVSRDSLGGVRVTVPDCRNHSSNPHESTRAKAAVCFGVDENGYDIVPF